MYLQLRSAHLDGKRLALDAEAGLLQPDGQRALAYVCDVAGAGINGMHRARVVRPYVHKLDP